MPNFTKGLKELLNEDVQDTIVNNLNMPRYIADELTGISEEHAFWLAKNVKKQNGYFKTLIVTMLISFFSLFMVYKHPIRLSNLH